MGIYAGITKPDYSIADGKYPARLIQIIQVGSQRFEKNGKEWFSPQVILGFEFPTVTYENQNGETVSNVKSGTYFLSMSPSRLGMIGLREIMDGLRGSDEYTEEELEKFDISQFLGKPCVVALSGVESKGVVYQNITSVEQYKETAELPTYREAIMVSVDNFEAIEMVNIPDWIKDKIRNSKEYTELSAASTAAPIERGQDDEVRLEDVPF